MAKSRYRRLTVHYERRTGFHGTFLKLGCTLICYSRLHRRSCNHLLLRLVLVICGPARTLGHFLQPGSRNREEFDGKLIKSAASFREPKRGLNCRWNSIRCTTNRLSCHRSVSIASVSWPAWTVRFL